MSEDAAKFVGYAGLDPLCEMHAGPGLEASPPPHFDEYTQGAWRLGRDSVRASTVPAPFSGSLTVERAKDGGFLVTQREFNVAHLLFAAGTINEACEYLEDMFS